MSAPKVSYIQSLNARLLREERAEHGRGPRTARDPWCITALLRGGHIAASQHGAAVRLSRLMERGLGQGSSGRMEAVDGGGVDPHARLMDAAVCAREAECALASVRTRLSGDHLHVRIACLDAALSFPHRSTSQAARDAGVGYGRTAEFVRHLTPGLDLLVVYFDACDAQAERERNRL